MKNILHQTIYLLMIIKNVIKSNIGFDVVKNFDIIRINDYGVDHDVHRKGNRIASFAFDFAVKWTKNAGHNS